MPTRYPQKNATEQIFHPPTEGRDYKQTENRDAAFRNSRNTIQHGRPTGKSAITRHYGLEIKMYVEGEKESSEEEGISSVGEGEQAGK